MKILVAFFTLSTLYLSLYTIASKEIKLNYPSYWEDPVYNFEANPLDSLKIQIGRALFHDPILSKNGTISCTSCHSQYSAFTHSDHKLSHGIDDQIGTRNSPALMNLAWQSAFMWDGAINHLDMQSLAPINHPKEMGESIENVVTKLSASPIYPRLFQKAYGDSVITGSKVLKCLSQFMLTMVTSNSKYDQYIAGEIEFSNQEKHGYELFKTNCSSCHQEPLFSTYNYERNGLPIDTSLNDFGRMNITNDRKDSLFFKIPTLRNIEHTGPYMHDGRFEKLYEVINHYNSVENQSLLRIQLSENDKVDLVAFLLTLTDREFIFNKKFSYPREIFQNKTKD